MLISHQPLPECCASPACIMGSYQVEAHLDVVEVLGLGDGGGQPAVAEVASHQLSVCT